MPGLLCLLSRHKTLRMQLVTCVQSASKLQMQALLQGLSFVDQGWMFEQLLNIGRKNAFVQPAIAVEVLGHAVGHLSLITASHAMLHCL